MANPPEHMRGVHLAACFGLKNIVQVMIDEDESGNVDSQADCGHTALSFAAEHGFKELSQFLLERGASADPKDTRDEWTPLFTAVCNRDEEMLEPLANAGADLEALHWHGSSPLGIAAYPGNESMAKRLLDRGAKVTPRGPEAEPYYHFVR